MTAKYCKNIRHATIPAVEVFLALIDVFTAPGTLADNNPFRLEQVLLICTDTRIGLDQLTHLRFNFGHELVRVCIALGNLGQTVFPFSSQSGRGQAFRQNHRQIDAVLGGDKLFALALHKAHLHQFFQNRGAGGGCAQPLALCFL